jgi:DNA-binding CsgD family transcriptional regulator
MAPIPRAPAVRGRSSELQRLDRLLDDARAGRSGVLVVRGEAGMGKTTLLQYAAARATAFRIGRIAGAVAEMELPFAGLHQLCAPLRERLDTLPAPQRDALRVALGYASGDPPDRLLLGLATLTLLAEAAEEQPLLCLVDDLQWLDGASAQVLRFVAGRLLAEPIAIVFAVREPAPDRTLAGLPELRLEGLGHEDARALLETVVAGRLDVHVRERMIAETGGNPLALLELPRSMSDAELSGGFGHPGAPVLEDSFRRRLDALPADTRRLLQLAAADAVGEPLLVWRAAERLGIDPQAATAAIDAGLLELGVQVRFRHPAMRSTAYGSATPAERHALHAALAEATDAQLDPDRRAWHRALATPAPDDQVAAELEHSAGRALARGGVAAAAAFLETAATLTPAPAERARRLLAAARAKRDAGALEAALELLIAIEAGPVDALQAAEIEQLRGEIAFDQRRVKEAARRLVSAARHFDALDPRLARTTHLKALGAAMWAGPEPLREAAEAARAAPVVDGAPRTVDLVVDAFALRVTEGYAAGAPALRRALDAVLALEADSDVGRWLWLTGSRAGAIAALELWDAERWTTLVERHVRLARDMGALVLLQFGLQSLIRTRMLAGELAAAQQGVEEVRALADATGTSPVGYTDMTLAAWRGQEAETAELIERQGRESTALGIGRVLHLADYSAAVLANGIGRYDAALEAAGRAFAHDHLGYAPFVVPEIAEAASRTGDAALVERVLAWMRERTPPEPGDWALGIEARVRALTGEDAERWHRESIDRLARTRLRLELARSRLLYGEWLRREGRRVDAREQLRVAREALLAMGAEGFAERARRELLATGEKVRKRSDDTRDELTPQEAQIARLAREGRTNPEIGAELFLSARTVEWHLKKVFTKLGISSRRALRDALPIEPAPVT